MPILRHIYDSATGAYHDVEVSQEVYDFYRRDAWAIRRNDKRFYAHEIQFSSLIGVEGSTLDCFDEFFSESSDPLCVLCNRDVAINLWAAFCSLPFEEQELLFSLIVEGHSERWYGQKMGVAQKTVHNRKTRALKILRLHMKTCEIQARQ